MDIRLLVWGVAPLPPGCFLMPPSVNNQLIGLRGVEDFGVRRFPSISIQNRPVFHSLWY